MQWQQQRPIDFQSAYLYVIIDLWARMKVSEWTRENLFRRVMDGRPFNAVLSVTKARFARMPRTCPRKRWNSFGARKKFGWTSSWDWDSNPIRYVKVQQLNLWFTAAMANYCAKFSGWMSNGVNIFFFHSHGRNIYDSAALVLWRCWFSVRKVIRPVKISFQEYPKVLLYRETWRLQNRRIKQQRDCMHVRALFSLEYVSGVTLLVGSQEGPVKNIAPPILEIIHGKIGGFNKSWK